MLVNVIASRYLNKLAEQIIALVSPEQANGFVWDTGARNKDLPVDQMEDDDVKSVVSSSTGGWGKVSNGPW